ncbi:dnaJ homolog subfamily C member 24-like [Anneissia japonica]|uniref:dnaJ homolog subfamily C member 24-like n=1 Tax=Anneissia japonica TaxID=1529436 RepID=UPI001425A15C|nr:dnaJ homolog subfamily C member 24-like [Anneissia japonica]
MAASKHDDLYEIIGSDRSASKEELKKSYRKALLQCYPDKVEDSKKEAALQEYLKLESAWKVLGDDDSRRRYDMCIRDSSSVKGRALKKPSNVTNPLIGFYFMTEKHVQQTVAVNEEVEVEDMDFEDDVAYYPCRCGGNYIIQEAEVSNDVIVACDTCSLHIRLIVTDQGDDSENIVEENPT